jgi:hypothetical protein
LLLISINSQAFDFEINADIEIPAVCEHLPEELTAVDLSAACLSAQLAAEAWPPLLPAANRLCMILEGMTAEVVHLQMAVNNIYEVCDTAMAELEDAVKRGTNEFYLEETDIASLLKRLSSVTNDEELKQKALTEPGEFIGTSDDDWLDDILNNDREPEKSLVKKKLLEQVAGAEFLALENLDNDNRELIRQLQEGISNTVTIKQSQDLSMRIVAEIGFQQNVFNQLLGKYLELESAMAQRRITQEEWYRKLLKKRESGE